MDKVAVITGSASGIARGLTNRLLREGCRVIATDINEQGLLATSKELDWPAERVRLLQLDVRDREGWDVVIERAVQEWGRVEMVFNIAGYGVGGNIHELDPAEIDRVIDINLKGVINGTRAAARVMVKQGYGQIVNLASVAGLFPVPGLNLYCASKFAVRGFSLSVAQELKPFGITVTVVEPATIKTPMVANAVEQKEAVSLFSFPLLEVDQLADIILKRAIGGKQREVVLPVQAAAFSKISGLFPGLVQRLQPLLNLQAARAQAKVIQQRDYLNWK